MDRNKRAELILEWVRSIRASVGEVDLALDTEELQVGDFQFIDGSLRVLARETDSLATYLEGMLADRTRTDG